MCLILGVFSSNKKHSRGMALYGFIWLYILLPLISKNRYVEHIILLIQSEWTELFVRGLYFN